MSDQGEAPPQRVFLSHASADTDRFVLEFATALRARGVDVWLDRWEMLPGDSLVRKIFSEGLDAAAAVVVVVSANSVTRPWVAEELDAAVVKRIQDGSQLIPVVLDNLASDELPAAIRHLVYEPVSDLDRIEEPVDRVCRAIFGQRDRPPLLPVPDYARMPIVPIAPLDRLDNLVLRSIGEEAIRDDGTRFDTAEYLSEATRRLGVSTEDLIESIQVLDEIGFISVQHTLGRGVEAMRRFDLVAQGLDAYLTHYEPRFTTWQSEVVARLGSWQGDQGGESDLAAQVDAPRIVVQRILDELQARGLIRLSKPGGGGWHFFSISPQLRRLDR